MHSPVYTKVYATPPDYINVYAFAWYLNVCTHLAILNCMHSPDYINVYALAWDIKVMHSPGYIKVYESPTILCDALAY